MTGRRRDARYRLSVPYEGSLLVLQDVSIERYDEHDVWAVSGSPAVSGQELTLDVTTPDEHSTVDVRVIESTPVIVGQDVRYRLRLGIIAAGA